MTRTEELSLEQLDARRKEILDRIGISYDDLAALAAARSLAGDEWEAWEEIREIDFLRNK
jgi:hypothetical protein